MANGSLQLVDLGEGRIPLGALFLGLISNFQTTTISGEITLEGDTSSISIDAPLTVGPIGLSVGSLTGTTIPFTATIPSGTSAGLHQAHINFIRDGNTIGRVVITISLLDLNDANVEDLDPVTPVGGVLQLLQVQSDNYVVIEE